MEEKLAPVPSGKSNGGRRRESHPFHLPSHEPRGKCGYAAALGPGSCLTLTRAGMIGKRQGRVDRVPERWGWGRGFHLPGAAECPDSERRSLARRRRWWEKLSPCHDAKGRSSCSGTPPRGSRGSAGRPHSRTAAGRDEEIARAAGGPVLITTSIAK